MAKRRTTARNTKFDFKGYVPANLDKATREEIRAWDITAGEVLDQFDRLLDSGYSITLKFDKEGEGRRVNISALDVRDDVNGWILNARAATLFQAMVVVWYKHSILLQGDWATEISRNLEYDDFD